MSEIYKVYNPPKEMIDEVLKNPIEPFIRFYGEFLADGIDVPGKDEDTREYLNLCKEKDIAPFTMKELKYGKIEETISKHPEGVNGIFSGGKTNYISIKTVYDEELKRLNELYIPSLIENNYDMTWGQLVFGERSFGSHENEGTEPVLAINITPGKDRKKIFKLDIKDHYIEKDRKDKFENWVKGLEKKFSLI